MSIPCSVLPAAIVVPHVIITLWYQLVVAFAQRLIDVTWTATMWFVHRPCSGIIVWLMIVAFLLDFTNDYDCVRMLYGGEDDECIRFMNTELSEEQWLQQLDTERLAIEELPIYIWVKSSEKCQFFFAGRCPAPRRATALGPQKSDEIVSLHPDQTPLTLADTFQLS